MKLTNEQIQKILVGQNYLPEDVVAKAMEEIKKNGKSISSYLLDQGLLTKDLYGQALAEFFGIQYLNTQKINVDDKVLTLIPELFARAKGVIALSRDKEGVLVGMTNPGDLETKHFVEKSIGEPTKVYYITDQDFNSVLDRYKVGLKDEFSSLLEEMDDETKSREERDELTVKMVDMLLQYGHQNKSSDVHIEPYIDKVLVRFRIDGVMHDMLEIPKGLEGVIVTRVKILSKLRTDEHRAAQDGKLRFDAKDEKVDVRVSIVPVGEGENVVMRLLSSKSRQFGLKDIGFSEEDMVKVNKAIDNPHGMLLVTGPTGSGKTTTIYSMLKILNRREVHISTIEDPVEYNIEGISQIQVDPRTNLTFAKGLRAIVRQDPDIIMVGEIRDSETAGIAVNSAMTGHLVLSTLHANDAATTLPRLLDMGIEPFLVASTVNVVVAQRLVRKICGKCRTSQSLTSDEKRIIESEPGLLEYFSKNNYKDLDTLSVYKGVGCKICGDTGYSGRIGVFEVLEMTEKIKDMVVKRAPNTEIIAAAKEEGMNTILEDGLSKVLSGVTTLQEVLRVTKE